MSPLVYLVLLLPFMSQVCSTLDIVENFEIEFEQIDVEVQPNDLVSPKCMDCICQVESHCHPIGCRMDVGSLSCGPFQIKKGYWTDCGSPGGDYETCTRDYTCSYNCVQRYMARYIKFSGCLKNCESYARIHNGGPRGCTNPNTMGYWKKMESKGCTPYS